MLGSPEGGGDPCPEKLSTCHLMSSARTIELFVRPLSSGYVHVCWDMWQIRCTGEASCSCVGFVPSPGNRDHTHKRWHVSGSWEGAWTYLNSVMSSEKPQVLSLLLAGGGV